MSWIYTVVIAGLLFSTGSQVETKVSNTETSHVNRTGQARETEKLDKSYPLSANGRVSVSNVNGSIVIEAWDRNEVHLEATKTADTKEALADVEIKVDSTADSFRVESDYKDWNGNWNDNSRGHRDQNLEVQYKLSVPRKAVLNEIETVNGSVAASNFMNFTKASSVNGSVTGQNLRGTANLSTVNGDVTANFEMITQGSTVNLDSVNGSISLVLPSDANATLKAESLNGAISTDFGLPVRKGEYVGHDLYGRLGAGDVKIKLSNVNGSVAINRKKDGRTASPATNLLQNKNRNDSDWDDSEFEGVKVDTDKLNRDIQRSVKDAQRSQMEAMKAVQKAMANIEIPKIDIQLDQKALQESLKASMKARDAALWKMKEAIWLSDSPMIERKSNTFNIKGTPAVIVDAGDCDVSIRGWDQPTVKYALTEVSSRRGSEPSNVTERQEGSSVTIKVTGDGGNADAGSWFRRNGSRRLEIFVPRKANLKIKSAGEIRMEGVSGTIDLEGGEGQIDVRGSKGDLTINNGEGMVRVIGFSGAVTTNTDDGDVYLDGDFDKIDGRSNDGSFTLTVPENANADIKTAAEAEFDSVPNVTNPSEGQWRIGLGGRNYSFTTDGDVKIQSRNLLTN